MATNAKSNDPVAPASDIFSEVISEAPEAGSNGRFAERQAEAAEQGLTLTRELKDASVKGQYEYVLTNEAGVTFKTNTLTSGNRSVDKILVAMKAKAAPAESEEAASK